MHVCQRKKERKEEDGRKLYCNNTIIKLCSHRLSVCSYTVKWIRAATDKPDAHARGFTIEFGVHGLVRGRGQPDSSKVTSVLSRTLLKAGKMLGMEEVH